MRHLRYVATTTQHITTQYKYNAIQCNAMLCNAMQRNAMQCHAMPCNAMQPPPHGCCRRWIWCAAGFFFQGEDESDELSRSPLDIRDQVRVCATVYRMYNAQCVSSALFSKTPPQQTPLSPPGGYFQNLKPVRTPASTQRHTYRAFMPPAPALGVGVCTPKGNKTNGKLPEKAVQHPCAPLVIRTPLAL